MKVAKEQFIGVTYEELLAENAKLRELVQTYYEALRHGAEPAEWVTDDVQDLRELGVEVDG